MLGFAYIKQRKARLNVAVCNITANGSQSCDGGEIQNRYRQVRTNNQDYPSHFGHKPNRH